MKLLWERLAKLIDVKSFMTLGLTVVVIILALKGLIDIKDIYLIIIGFYFGTQSEKKNNN